MAPPLTIAASRAALPHLQAAAYMVVMQIGAAASRRPGDPLGQIFHRAIELGPRKLPIGIRAPHEGKQRVNIPVLGGDFGHDLLREDIERRLGDGHAVELPWRTARNRASDSISSSRERATSRPFGTRPSE